MAQFLVFRRLSDDQTIFRPGGSEKFFLVVHGKVTVSMLVPKSQLAAQTLRRLERRKLERQQELAAKKAKEASAKAKAAEAKAKGVDPTPGASLPNIDPATNTPADESDAKDDKKTDGQTNDGKKSDGEDGEKQEEKQEGKHPESENDPFALMEVPTAKLYIGDTYRPDIATTGAKVTATMRAAAVGHTELIMVKRKALREALESRRVKKSLESVTMFKPLSDKAVKGIMSGSQTRTWRCGQIIMKDGRPVTRCVVLTSGTVQLEWKLPNVAPTKMKHGSEYGAALVEASIAIAKKDGRSDEAYQDSVTRMAKETVERAKRIREMKSLEAERKKYILLTTLLKGDIIGLLEVLNNLKMPYQVRATSVVEGMLLSPEYLQKTPPERRQADESSSLVLIDSLSRRIEEQVNLLTSSNLLEPQESAVTMDHIRECENWRIYTSNLALLKKSKGVISSNQILKKATSCWKKLRNSKNFIGEAKSDRRNSLKMNAVEGLARGRPLITKPSNAIGYEQDVVHPDSKSAVVRKLVPKLSKKLEKFRHRNQLSATFLTHLDQFAVHKPPKSAAATTDEDKNESKMIKHMSTRNLDVLPKI